MSEAKKFDQGKPRISLIPNDAMNEMAQAFTHGATKYGAHNYRLGMDISRLLDAAYRHMNAFKEGEDIDVDSGNSHLGHALASLAMATFVWKNLPERDDRWKKELKE